jgi:ribonuclease R
MMASSFASHRPLSTMLKSDLLQQLQQLKNEIKANRALFKGRVKGTRQRFGFVILDEDKREIYLPPDEMLKVLPGDEVEVELKTDDKGKEYAILERLIKTHTKQFVGLCTTKGSTFFVEPDQNGLTRWIFIPPNKRKKAKEGQYLLCRLSQHPSKTGKAQAEVLEVIGDPNQPGIERAYLLRKYNIAEVFSNAVLDQIKTLDEQLLESLAAERTDATNIPFVTIDAVSTQDMDDALYAETNEEGWLLKVAVAEPTAFIPKDSPLERELIERASSIYLPGQAIPMLPESISNQLCSLKPYEKRLAKICTMQVLKDGSFGTTSIEQAVIRSQAKLSYEEVATWIDQNQPSQQAEIATDKLQPSILALKDCTEALLNWRKTNALVSNNKPEYRLILDEQQKVIQIIPRVVTSAHRMVEECMIAANRIVSTELEKAALGLFIGHSGVRKERRTHFIKAVQAAWPEWKDPSLEKLEDFKTLMTKDDDLKPVAKAPNPRPPVSAIALRLLDRSRFSTTATPHFGMGLSHYTTFTSPLRKASDFLVHRLLDNAISNIELHPERLSNLQEALLNTRKMANELEQWLKSQYMEKLIGQTFSGQIVRTHSSGFVVRLDENGVEGIVSTKEMNGKYSFDQTWLSLSLKNKSKQFILDQSVSVTICDFDKTSHQLIYTLAEEPTSSSLTEQKQAI